MNNSKEIKKAIEWIKDGMVMLQTPSCDIVDASDSFNMAIQILEKEASRPVDKTIYFSRGMLEAGFTQEEVWDLIAGVI